MTDNAWIAAALLAARPQALSALLRYFRNLDTAEEAFQEASLRALRAWPRNGPPRDVAAWLILVGRNAALDGNYAVFGNVVGTAGLAALDAIGAVPVYDGSSQLGAAFSELPLTAPSLDVASFVMVNSVAVVPEPSSLLLAAAGLAAMAFARRS